MIIPWPGSLGVMLLDRLFEKANDQRIQETPCLPWPSSRVVRARLVACGSGNERRSRAWKHLIKSRLEPTAPRGAGSPPSPRGDGRAGMHLILYPGIRKTHSILFPRQRKRTTLPKTCRPRDCKSTIGRATNPAYHQPAIWLRADFSPLERNAVTMMESEPGGTGAEKAFLPSEYPTSRATWIRSSANSSSTGG